MRQGGINANRSERNGAAFREREVEKKKTPETKFDVERSRTGRDQENNVQKLTKRSRTTLGQRRTYIDQAYTFTIISSEAKRDRERERFLKIFITSFFHSILYFEFEIE